MQAFDPLNQLKSRKDGEGNETLYNYDGEGLLNWQREPKGDQTSYSYNALRSLKTVTDARSKTWTFAYDAAQNLKSVVDPRTFVTNYDYDNLDRLTKVTQPLGKITLNEYDENSNKVKITDPNGQITDLIPDQLDRTQRVQHKRAVSNTIERAIYYQLDAEGNAFQIDEQITDGGTVNRTYARQFDQRNRLVQTTDYRNKTVRFDYDRANNVTLITDAASKRTGYVYDEQNRVKTVTTNDGESIVYNWYKDGLLKDVNYKNGLKREYSYDNADRVSSIKNTVGVNAQGTQTQEFIYGYDPNSNRLNETRRTDGATSKQLAFNYDELNRLALSTETTPAPATQPAPGQSIQVTENSLLTGNGYDAVGNRDGITTQTKVRTITRTANGQGQVTETSSEQAGQPSTATAQFDALNRLTNLSENNVNTAFAYDNNGNLLSETVGGTVQKRYEYDTRDQLKKVFAGANTQLAQFDYDFQRHRTSKQTANTNLHYVYAGDDVVDEFDSSSGLLPLQNRYELGAGEVVKGELRNEPTNYYFSDALGSTTNLSQTNGTQSFSTSTSEYDSFGKINNQTGASANAIGYTGQRLDSETGLMALGNGERYYSPALARFTQQDSVTGGLMMPQSLNRYSYVHNNPFRFTDPSGNIADDNRGAIANSARQYGINKKGETGWGGILLNAAARTGYDVWDTFTFGTLSRQEETEAKFENREITAQQYRWSTFKNAAYAGAQVGLMAATGGAGSALTTGAGLTTRVLVGAGLGIAEQYGRDRIDQGFGFRKEGEYSSAGAYALSAFTGGLFGALSPGKAASLMAKEGKLTLGTELKLLKGEASELAQTSRQVAKAFGEGFNKPLGSTNLNMLGGEDIVERLAKGVNNALKSPALENSPYHPDRVAARVKELWNTLYSKKPWKEGFYHGKKPRYSNEGHHDRSSSNFRGGGDMTTELPIDAQQVYQTAVPDFENPNTWYGMNSEGEFYRYQGSQQGEDVIVHWNGRENSSRGLPGGVPKKIKERFETR